jgi:hypothetical protein
MKFRSEHLAILQLSCFVSQPIVLCIYLGQKYKRTIDLSKAKLQPAGWKPAPSRQKKIPPTRPGEGF